MLNNEEGQTHTFTITITITITGAMIVYDAKDLVPVVEGRAQPTVLEARESSSLIEGRAAAVDQFN